MTSAYPGLATHTVGAIGELRVSVDLLRLGYEVFRAISATASCDLAVLQNGRLLRVEVRTGYESRHSGKITGNFEKQFRADILAIALPDRIVYRPPLEGFRT